MLWRMTAAIGREPASTDGGAPRLGGPRARNKSLTALVRGALDETDRRNDLLEVLAAMDAEFGKPGKSAERWARRVLRR